MIEKFINLFITISEKANDLSGDYDSNTFEAEMLHTSFALVLRELTEKQYNSIPLIYRKTIEKTEDKLLKYVSEEYKKDYDKLISEGERFRSAKSKNDKKLIGFDVKEETIL